MRIAGDEGLLESRAAVHKIRRCEKGGFNIENRAQTLDVFEAEPSDRWFMAAHSKSS
jgi:hypothetical protein